MVSYILPAKSKHAGSLAKFSAEIAHLALRGMVDYLGDVDEETKSKAVYAMGVAF